MFKHEWVAWGGFKSLTTLGKVQDKTFYKKYKVLEFWNAGQGRFFKASSKLWDSKNLLNFLSLWYLRLPSMPDEQNEMPKITLSEALPGFATSTPTTKNILSHFNIIYVSILNWTSTFHNSVNKTGYLQHTLNITELELFPSFTLATNPQTAAAITENLLFVCTMPHYVQYFPC